MSDLYGILGAASGMAIAPLIAKGTAKARRWVKRRMPEGRMKSILLTPLGFGKARREAEMAANIEDYRLLRSGELKGGRDSGPL